MSFRAAANQKGVVLSERKDAAFVRAGCDFQIDLHRWIWLAHPPAIAGGTDCVQVGLAIDGQIVKRHFVNVAGVEPGDAMPEVFSVVDAG